MGKEKIPAIADVGVNLMFLRDRDELMLVLSLQRGKGDRDIYERLERLRRAKARKNGGKLRRNGDDSSGGVGGR